MTSPVVTSPVVTSPVDTSTVVSTTVALVGAHGFGRRHLELMQPLRADGRIELLAVADPAGPSDLVDVPCYPMLADLLAEHSPEVVIIATPIGTHTTLAIEALQAGADVYLEKPPTPSLADHHRLVRQLKETGHVVQVGFQALGGEGLTRVRELMRSGALGELERVVGHGAWTRARSYYERSPWAGRRMLGGHRVADGVATNPLAHSVSVALNLAGVTSLDQMRVTTELYQAHGIETDDTAFVRVDEPGALPVALGLTTCAPEQHDPWVEVIGSRGSARLNYTTDVVEVTVDGATTSEQFGRTSLLENLLDHRDHGTPLLAPLIEQAPFTGVLEAIQSGPPPTTVDERFIDWQGEGADAVPVVEDVETHLIAAARSGDGLRAAGAPWAMAEPVTWTPRTELVAVRASDGRVLAELNDGSDIIPESSPRPYLHPVRSLAGAIVTDTHPADHDWHCGLGFVVPDVADRNFWGGRSYRAGDGYQWRDDHGSIRQVDVVEHSASHLVQDLAWSADGVELSERQRLAWEQVDDVTWRLDLHTSVTPVTPEEIEFGSPGSHGRVGGGYGGWFIRIAPCTDVTVRSGSLDGEEVVHGSTGPELVWEATFGARRARLRFASSDGDPWFVRVSDYPGVGSSLAWDQAVMVSRRAPLERGLRLEVTDLG